MNPITLLHTLVAGKEVEAAVRKYGDGSDALIVDGEVVSTNLTDMGYPLPPGQVHIRDYGLDEGLTKYLVEYGFVRNPTPITYGPFNTRVYRVEINRHVPREAGIK